MKKSLCALLCALILLASVAVVGYAETTEPHQSGCECAECAGSKPASDLTYTNPDAETTLKRDGLEEVISEKFGDDLAEAGKDSEKKLSAIEKFIERLRAFILKLADYVTGLSDPIRDFIKR